MILFYHVNMSPSVAKNITASAIKPNNLTLIF
nr:MAG TPA: hypothetical protein [Caudoviricetes sp.]DAO31673.1 MAG TPA: hypothetical protein [Caudoviricetes sp.]DAU99917.1 MAG TPA: hypothetical protein [Caudoviricetes sp.]DAY04469.1 MAG TPA: hypothetical protein [Caudoviricetes sp.]